MKQVYVTKDAYQDNSVRVNYFEKDVVRIIKKLEWNEEAQKIEEKNIEEIYDELLFCERLFWETSEAELDINIDNTRNNYEKRINTPNY
jgi:hypothetical protein